MGRLSGQLEEVSGRQLQLQRARPGAEGRTEDDARQLYNQVLYKDTRILELNNDLLARDRRIIDLQVRPSQPLHSFPATLRFPCSGGGAGAGPGPGGENGSPGHPPAPAQGGRPSAHPRRLRGDCPLAPVRSNPTWTPPGPFVLRDTSPLSVRIPDEETAASPPPGRAVAQLFGPARTGSPPPNDPADDDGRSDLTTESAPEGLLLLGHDAAAAPPSRLRHLDSHLEGCPLIDVDWWSGQIGEL